MSQQNKKRDRTTHVGTLRIRQDLESTEEEVSEIVEDASDDDTMLTCLTVGIQSSLVETSQMDRLPRRNVTKPRQEAVISH